LAVSKVGPAEGEKLEKWDDSRVKEIGQKQWATLQPA
jgi:hypothetical protein